MDHLFSITTIENEEKWNRLIQDISKYDYQSHTKYKNSIPKERFDYYLKQSFIDGAPYLPGMYLTDSFSECFGFWNKKYQRYYDRYFSPSLGIEKMLSKEIRSSYDNGKGSEFKSGKYYSVASSSRFATASFSENKGGIVSLVNEMTFNGQKKKCKISLEKDLFIHSTDGREISSPQMDVFIETDEDIYFIEVKCHEIFDSHKNINLKWKYMEARVLQDLLYLPHAVYKYTEITRNEYGNDVDYISVDGHYLTPIDFGCNLQTHHFDFKQFLCHLMGICDYCSSTEKKVHFYYLFYKNNHYIKKESAKVYAELERELNTIFGHFRNLYPNIDFGAMYNNQFNTLDSIDPTVY